MHHFLLRHVILWVLLFGIGAAAEEDTLVNLTTAVIGNGVITRNPDQTFYEVGTIISLTAIPDDGFVFLEWSGPVEDRLNAETTVLLKSNTLVSATFVPGGKPVLKTIPEDGDVLDFDVVETGLLSNAKVRSVTVTNVGDGTLEGTASVRAGTSRPYGIVTDPSFSLTPNQSIQITIVFDPFNVDETLGGVRLDDVLGVTSNGGSAEINLTGLAIQSGELGCSCSTAPSAVKRWGDAFVLLLALGVLAAARTGFSVA